MRFANLSGRDRGTVPPIAASNRSGSAVGMALAASVMAVAAASIVTWAVSGYGIGVSPDSAHYIGAARSLVSGHGLRFNGRPFSHWPPLYPLLLAGFSFGRYDPLQTARALAAAFAALNMALVAWIAFRQSRESVGAGICAGLLFLLSPEMLHVQTMAWSEPPFLCLTLLALLLFSEWIGRSNAPKASLAPLALAGLVLGLALVTRYVGVALLPPFLLCIAIRRSLPWRHRLTETVTLFATAGAPIFAWIVYCRVVAHSASDRPLAFHPPHSPPFALLAILLASGAALAGRLVRRPPQSGEEGADTLPIWLLAALISYSGFVIASITFLDALTPVDVRMLSPAFVFAGIYVVGLIWSDRKASCRRMDGPDAAVMASRRLLGRRIALSAALLIGGSRFGAIVPFARLRHDSGYGFTGRAWRSSPTLAWIEAQPANCVLYSNTPELVAFRTRRTVIGLPARYSPTSFVPNPNLNREATALQKAVREGALVAFLPGEPHAYLLSADDLERSYHLPVLLRLPDGVIYGYASAIHGRAMTQ